MLNHIVIMGRLCRDVELRRLDDGKAVASDAIACDRDFKNKDGNKDVDFIDVVAFGKTAEFFSKWFVKGSMAVVSGRLQIRSWQDKDGNKRRTAEVVAENVYFGDSKKDAETNPEGKSAEGDFMPDVPAKPFSVINDDDDQLPF